MRKRAGILLAALLAVALLLAGCGLPGQKAAAPQGDVIILYTNDIHCAIADGLGLAGVATARNAFLAQTNNVILADVGDAVQGGPIGTLTRGEAIIDLMNAAGYDVAAPGNHGFDYGMEQFFALTERANYPYVSANFMNAAGDTALPAYALLERGGVKVAFVGVTAPDTPTSSTPAYFQDAAGAYIYGFCRDDTGAALYAAVQRAVDKARAAGADYVIALSHLGTEEEARPFTSREVIANTTGLDAVLDAHAHAAIPAEMCLNKAGKEVLLSSTGSHLASIGCLVIAPGGALRASLITDGGVSEAVAAAQGQFEELLGKVVARSEVTLRMYDPALKKADGSPLRAVRVRETNLGDLCADAYLAATGADCALINGGGIRAEIPAGDITYGQIITANPYGNELCVVRATGQQILDALELGASLLPNENGGFMQAAGLTYAVDLSVPSAVIKDEHGMFAGVAGPYRVRDVLIGGEPLDREKTYALAGHDYMLKNAGDGCSMFRDCEVVLDCIIADYQALIDYITDDLGGVVGAAYASEHGAGRITLLNAGEEAGSSAP